MKEVYLAGGCFWGTERFFKNIKGVLQTEVGYANGHTENPSYEEVCRRNTGHAETVKVVFDENILPLPFLLFLYFEVIDPTLLNRQGGDEGTQYRTGIYYVDDADLPAIGQCLKTLAGWYEQPIVVEHGKLLNFYKAEEYHQDYLSKNAGGYCHISPRKMQQAKLARVNPALYPRPGQGELKERMPASAYAVTQHAATEPPFSHPYWNSFEAGLYVDATTGEPLFSSDDKFACDCGWPSFSKPVDPFVVVERDDLSHGMIRTEVLSRMGRAHLGHVFPDGPKESGGKRYCINGAAIAFIPRANMEEKGYGYLLDLVSEKHA